MKSSTEEQMRAGWCCSCHDSVASHGRSPAVGIRPMTWCRILVRAMASWNDATRLVYMEGWVLRIMRNAWIDMQRARRVRLEYADAFRMWSRSASDDEDATMQGSHLGQSKRPCGPCPRISAPFFCSSVWRDVLRAGCGGPGNPGGHRDEPPGARPCHLRQLLDEPRPTTSSRSKHASDLRDDTLR